MKFDPFMVAIEKNGKLYEPCGLASDGVSILTNQGENLSIFDSSCCCVNQYTGLVMRFFSEEWAHKQTILSMEFSDKLVNDLGDIGIPVSYAVAATWTYEQRLKIREALDVPIEERMPISKFETFVLRMSLT